MKVDVKLREFDMQRIKDDNVIVLIGKRKTGKSFLVKDIMYHHRDIPLGTVISGTEMANRFFGKFMPDLFIHYNYSPDLMQNVMRRQMLMTDRNDVDARAFLILDDLMDDAKAWIKDSNLKTVFFNGRHFKLFFMLSMQFSLGITPELRSNVDFVFILRESLNSNRKRLYEHYAGMFGTFDAFCQILDNCTENYECIVIDNTTQSNKLTDQVFWYKASAHDDFKVGHKQFWDEKKNADVRLSRQRALHGGGASSLSFQKKKSAIKINVRKVLRGHDDSAEEDETGNEVC